MLLLALAVSCFDGLLSGHILPGILFIFVAFAPLLAAAARYGAVTLLVGLFVSLIQPCGLVTLDISAWYATPSLVSAAITILLSIWSFRTALAGRPLLQPGFLDQ